MTIGQRRRGARCSARPPSVVFGGPGPGRLGRPRHAGGVGGRRPGPGQQVGAPGRAVGAQPGPAVAVRRRADHHGDLPGRRCCAPESTTSATMQVMLSGPPPRIASSMSWVTAWSRSAQRDQGLAQGLLADHVGQPVRAEQVPVSGPGLDGGQVGLGLGAALQRAHHQRALRVRGRLGRAEPAVVDQRLDQRVVPGDLMEVAVAEQVGAGVADVADGHRAPRPQQRGQRGAHALDGWVLDAHLVQRGVGRGDGPGELAEHAVRGHVVVQAGQGRDRHGTGYLAGGMPAHAVGDREQVRARVRRVLVSLAEEADV